MNWIEYDGTEVTLPPEGTAVLFYSVPLRICPFTKVWDIYFGALVNTPKGLRWVGGNLARPPKVGDMWAFATFMQTVPHAETLADTLKNRAKRRVLGLEV